ncbi:OmpH family outer membrane protein [Myxococcota bacterium]|nr:OmpH family outer membrane protein [Myxococcota bacterium]
MMSLNLILDMSAVLEQSQVGKDASDLLSERLKEAAKAQKEIRARAAGIPMESAKRKIEEDARAYQQEALQALDKARLVLRTALLNRVRKIVGKIAQERNAEMVIDASALLLFDSKNDITPEVIKAVDALGPLEV